MLTTSPAQAKGLHETDFGFRTTAYGTRVTAQDVQLRSGRTAFSYISCTRLAGMRDEAHIAEGDAPGDNPAIHVGAVESKNITYRRPKKGIVGVRGTNRITEVTLGPADGPQLKIEALRTTARAWHKKGEGFQAVTHVDSLPITATGIVPEEAPPELRDGLNLLLDGVSDGVQGVFDAIRENAGPIEVPGLGTIHMGYERTAVRKNFAAASAYVLKVDIFGQDGVQGGGDDSQVALGRSWARIDKNLPAGVFHGVGYGAEIDALDEVLEVGRVATRALPCPGTNGKVRESHLADLDLGGQGVLQVEGLGARSFGIQRKSGYARGWTEGQVARIFLGNGDQSLEIQGMLGRAQVVQTKAGKVRKSAKGTSPGILTVNGEAQEFPDPGQALEIPGLAKIEVNVVEKKARSIRVSAVRITLLGDSPGVSVIKLGNAHARITRV